MPYKFFHSGIQLESILQPISPTAHNIKEITAKLQPPHIKYRRYGEKIFASTVLLYNDVPMEIVSELLGHSSIKITQEYYGKIVQRRISEEMERVSEKLK